MALQSSLVHRRQTWRPVHEPHASRGCRAASGGERGLSSTAGPHALLSPRPRPWRARRWTSPRVAWRALVGETQRARRRGESLAGSHPDTLPRGRRTAATPDARTGWSRSCRRLALLPEAAEGGSRARTQRTSLASGSDKPQSFQGGAVGVARGAHGPEATGSRSHHRWPGLRPEPPGPVWLCPAHPQAREHRSEDCSRPSAAARTKGSGFTGKEARLQGPRPSRSRSAGGSSGAPGHGCPTDVLVFQTAETGTANRPELNHRSFFPRSLEARTRKPSCQGLVPSGGSRRGSFLPLPAAGAPQCPGLRLSPRGLCDLCPPLSQGCPQLRQDPL